MKRIGLNADIGEGFPWDWNLMDVVSQVNVGCGVHAGSAVEAVEIARESVSRGLVVYAHPSYPDRDFFGRRTWTDWSERGRERLKESLLAQVLPFVGLVTGIKPHGALYTDSVTDLRAAALVGSIALEYGLSILAFPCPNNVTAAHLAGVSLRTEGFLDRHYGKDGRLVSRHLPGAMLTDDQEIKAQILTLAPLVDSLCVHGDHEGCVEIAQLARRTLVDAGYEVAG